MPRRPGPLGSGQGQAPGAVELHVDRFGFTTNNVTYGLWGDVFSYWKFFPAPDGWGQIPVWGFGEVTSSGVDGIAVGERFYGYFAMSDAVSLQAKSLRARPSAA